MQVTFLPNFDILITDQGNKRVIEVDRDKNMCVAIQQWDQRRRIYQPLCQRHTLITDLLNNRIVEVTSGGKVFWHYFTNARKGSVAQPNPTRAVRLKNGRTLISDPFNHQVIEN